MFHIILFQPEIPPNTGNIIRLCANTGSTLHLIEPLGFSLDEKSLRRAGLDYHQLTNVHSHADIDACLETLPGSRVFAVETGCPRVYSEARFQAGDAFIFGPETGSLPPGVLRRVLSNFQLAIPMLTHERSLNLSNAVAVVVFEAWRQQGFGSGPA